MNIIPIKTKKIHVREMKLTELLERVLPRLSDRSILVITSKIVSLCEGSVAPLSKNKRALIEQEADWFVPPEKSPYHASLSITHSAFIAAGGIDESNADHTYVLLPRDAQKTANAVRKFLEERFKLRHVGVLITDSRSVPLRRGAIGVTLAWSGFKALKDYRGKRDLFGRTIQYEVANIADALASAAVALMGEGAESTPLALIHDVPFVDFTGKNPTPKERDFFYLTLKNDLFAPIINFKALKKGKSALFR